MIENTTLHSLPALHMTFTVVSATLKLNSFPLNLLIKSGKHANIIVKHTKLTWCNNTSTLLPDTDYEGTLTDLSREVDHA